MHCESKPRDRGGNGRPSDLVNRGGERCAGKGVSSSHCAHPRFASPSSSHLSAAKHLVARVMSGSLADQSGVISRVRCVLLSLRGRHGLQASLQLRRNCTPVFLKRHHGVTGRHAVYNRLRARFIRPACPNRLNALALRMSPRKGPLDAPRWPDRRSCRTLALPGDAQCGLRSLRHRRPLRPVASSHDDVQARIESLRVSHVLGANVTVPHKEVVAALLEDLSSTARRIGAVNTIINRNGHLSGDNTDAWGFARTIEHALPGDAWSAVVVGAGGPHGPSSWPFRTQVQRASRSSIAHWSGPNRWLGNCQKQDPYLLGRLFLTR